MSDRLARPKPVARAARLDLAAATSEAHSEADSGLRIGFSLDAAGRGQITAFHPNTTNFGASITKAMLLVAYLRQLGARAVGSVARSELTQMIEVSDNAAADWVYDHLRSPAAEVEAVASLAGMTDFRLDTSDPVYVLGQSVVTANDFARLFVDIEALLPPRELRFALGLLSHVEERVGLLAAGLPGVVYSKEGWKPETEGEMGAPYIVNQAAQFNFGNTTYGMAVTVGDVQDEAEGEAAVCRIAAALVRASITRCG